MYIYNTELSGAQFLPSDHAIDSAFPLSGGVRFGAAERSKSANQPMPQWLQDGVRQQRWKPETAAGLWALRKIASGK